VKNTLSKERIKGGIDLPDAIISLAIWKFLQLRGYVDEKHELTPQGIALSNAMSALEPTVKANPEVPGLYEAVLLAFELIRFGLLNAKNPRSEVHGLPMNGSEEDKSSLLLLSRCATLLKLRHQSNGYTGPLNKNLLSFQSLSSAVCEANRDLTEAVVASMFMYGQAKREREDGWQLSHRLPFLGVPDVAMGIAVKTLLDDVPLNESPDDRATRIRDFPTLYVPYATKFTEDLAIAYAFFDALYVGVKSLGDQDMPAADRAGWDKTSKYLELRR